MASRAAMTCARLLPASSSSRYAVRAAPVATAHALRRWAHAPSAAFGKAAEAVQKLPQSPGNDDKLALYALFKQATVGANKTSKPGRLADHHR
jgi:hypothetical protein